MFPFRWHLGYCNEKYLPTSRGFDTFYGFYNGGEGYYDHLTTLGGGVIYDFVDNEVVDDSAAGTYSGVSKSRNINKLMAYLDRNYYILHIFRPCLLTEPRRSYEVTPETTHHSFSSSPLKTSTRQ